MDSYEAAIEFLYGRINYERVDAQAYSTSDFKLDRMRSLLSLIGNPQDRIPAVHVAGTKGKGSTCTMIAAVLAAAGQRVGLYISPHISVFEERMTVNGQRPSPQELVAYVNRLLPVVAEMDRLPGQMQPTYFELATAIAWLYFIDQQADLVVLETGLGGRLDSTNICRPKVCLITNISRDHTHILGSTVRQIAWEKGGIIKTGVPLISGVTQPDARELINQLCRERNAPIFELGPDVSVSARRSVETGRLCTRKGSDPLPDGPAIALSPDGMGSDPFLVQSQTGPTGVTKEPHSWVDVKTPRTAWKNLPVALRGAHQATNTAMAMAAIDELRAQGIHVAEEHVQQGLAGVEWPARVEVVSHLPTVIIDAAHNWESARALVATLSDEFTARRRILIFAATRDKDVTGLLRLLIPAFDTVIFTRYLDNPRSVPVQELQMFVHAISRRQFHVAETPRVAWQMARQWAGIDDLIAITGSFFLVAELRDVVMNAMNE